MDIEFNNSQAKELSNLIRDIESNQSNDIDYRFAYDELSNRAIVRLVDISNSIEEAIEDIEKGKIEASEVRKSLSEPLSKINGLIELAMYGVRRD